MRKDDPRLILNLNIKDEEIEQKINLAMDDYIEKNIDAIIDEKIEKAINKKVEDYFKDIDIVTYDSYKNHKKRLFFNELDKKIEDLIKDRINTKVAVVIINKITALVGDVVDQEQKGGED